VFHVQATEKNRQFYLHMYDKELIAWNFVWQEEKIEALASIYSHIPVHTLAII